MIQLPDGSKNLCAIIEIPRSDRLGHSKAAVVCCNLHGLHCRLMNNDREQQSPDPVPAPAPPSPQQQQQQQQVYWVALVCVGKYSCVLGCTYVRFCVLLIAYYLVFLCVSAYHTHALPQITRKRTPTSHSTRSHTHAHTDTITSIHTS